MSANFFLHDLKKNYSICAMEYLHVVSETLLNHSSLRMIRLIEGINSGSSSKCQVACC